IAPPTVAIARPEPPPTALPATPPSAPPAIMPAPLERSSWMVMDRTDTTVPVRTICSCCACPYVYTELDAERFAQPATTASDATTAVTANSRKPGRTRSERIAIEELMEYS